MARVGALPFEPRRSARGTFDDGKLSPLISETTPLFKSSDDLLCMTAVTMALNQDSASGRHLQGNIGQLEGPGRSGPVARFVQCLRMILLTNPFVELVSGGPFFLRRSIENRTRSACHSLFAPDVASV